jgi:hypothetical protein
MRLLLLPLLLLACIPAFAADGQPSPAKTAAIEKLFTAIKMQEKYEAGLIAGFRAGAEMGSDQLPPEYKGKMIKALDRVQKMMLEKVGYAQVKEDLIALYDGKFSQAEVEASTKLFESPAGQVWVAKELELLPEAMKVNQSKVKALMPEIQKIMMEEMSSGGSGGGAYAP